MTVSWPSTLASAISLSNPPAAGAAGAVVAAGAAGAVVAAGAAGAVVAAGAAGAVVAAGAAIRYTSGVVISLKPTP